MVDPLKRITLDGIYNHPWFLKNLPPGVREMNERPENDAAGLQVSVHATVCLRTPSPQRIKPIKHCK